MFFVLFVLSLFFFLPKSCLLHPHRRATSVPQSCRGPSGSLVRVTSLGDKMKLQIFMQLLQLNASLHRINLNANMNIVCRAPRTAHPTPYIVSYLSLYVVYRLHAKYANQLQSKLLLLPPPPSLPMEHLSPLRLEVCTVSSLSTGSKGRLLLLLLAAVGCQC